jgi:pyrimidine oxygenase
MGIWPGTEHYRRRYDYCAEYVSIMRELWETGRSDLKGDFFQQVCVRAWPHAPVPPFDTVLRSKSTLGQTVADPLVEL